MKEVKMDFNLNQIVERLQNEKKDRENTIRTTRVIGKSAAKDVLSVMSYSKMIKLENIDKLDTNSSETLLSMHFPEYRKKIEDFANRVLCDLLEQSGGMTERELREVWEISFIETLNKCVTVILEKVEG